MLSALLVFATAGHAADVRIISSGGAQQILRKLAPQFEKASGKTVEVVIAVVGTIEQKLLAGERALADLQGLPRFSGHPADDHRQRHRHREPAAT
jgi:ABC-type molybdate transport system substrate-binding protein